ncbi:MAG: multiheme c-type cytochrome [Halobacteriota archaeon]|nr:multiheme c-type cytochrome [Halobacteriota archaeon]
MKGNKIALLMVAILAIGIFALPSTMAMFGGQHNWYDLEDDGNQVPCIKCHADVYDEFQNTGIHKTLAGGVNSTSGDFGDAGTYAVDQACHACHRTDLTGYTFASGDGTSSTAGEEAHAASTIACMECHEHGVSSLDANYSNYPFAGGFANMTAAGSSFDYNDSASDGSKAAHNDFIKGAIDDTLMEDSNEACITCHTHVAIDINWTHAYSMKLDAVQDSLGNWDCDDFETNGYYNITTYGNMSGAETAVNGTAGISGNNVTPP